MNSWKVLEALQSYVLNWELFLACLGIAGISLSLSLIFIHMLTFTSHGKTKLNMEGK
jgi:hypothetical protein